MKKFLLSLLLVCLFPVFADATLTCANMPPGATVLANIHFDTTDGEGQMWDLYPGAGTITTQPGSDGNVTSSILLPGNITGGQQVIWPKPGNQQPLTNLYSCFKWKMNADFLGIRQMNKLVFQAAQDWTYGKNSINGLLGLPVRGIYPPYVNGNPSLQMIFAPNSATTLYDNSHACAADFGLICYPNVNDTPVQRDTWYEVEFYTIASSCTTCRNATVKWWINGLLQGSYTNLNYGDGIVNEWQINHTWDGSGGLQCYNPTVWPVGRDCSQTSIHYFDELRLASSNGVAPPADTIAPTQVTNVAVSGTSANTITLTWNPATDNIGIAGYNVEMCTGQACVSYAAKQSTSGTGTSVVITGLNPATPYSFRLKGRDNSGNVSAQYSTPVSATTTSPGSGVVVRNTLLTDNFNRADNTDLGAAWDGDYYITGATAPLQIVGNKVRAGVASTKESNETYNAVTLPLDQWAQVTLSTWAADGTQRYGWVNLRAAAPQTPSYYQCQAARNDSGGYTTLIEREDGLGVYSYLAQDSSVTWAAGDILRCEAIGVNPTIISVYRNGTLITSVSDNASLTNVRIGAGIWTANLTAVELDDFAGGDFTGVTLPRILSISTDATGADVTWSGGPVSIRVNTDQGQVIVPIASFPGGRYNFVWPPDTTFACMFGVDAQGNVNTITEDYQCDVVEPSTADITPPTVSSPTPAGALAAGTTGATIGVVTSEAASCRYATSAGVAYASMTNTMTAAVSSLQHTAVVSGLSNGGTYSFYIKCGDSAGNITSADTLVTFTVNNVATDTNAPTAPIALVPTILNANQVQLTFTLATDDTGVAGYQVFGCITLSCDTEVLVANGAGSPIIVSGLTPNTPYSFKVRAFDAVLNFGVFTSVVNITTPVLDTVAPDRMVGLTAVRTGYDSFLISWEPGVDDRGVVGSAIEICVGDGCTVFKLHFIAYSQTSVRITGLASQLPYYFRGKHIDSAGNVSEEYSELAKGEPFPLQSGTVQGVCACQIP